MYFYDYRGVRITPTTDDTGAPYVALVDHNGARCGRATSRKLARRCIDALRERERTSGKTPDTLSVCTIVNGAIECYGEYFNPEKRKAFK